MRGFCADLKRLSGQAYEALSPIDFLDRVKFDISEFYQMNEILRDRKLFRKIKQMVVHLGDSSEAETGLAALTHRNAHSKP